MFDTQSLEAGLLATTLLLGLRHGLDWDHIIAITDLASTQEHKRRGMLLGTSYVLGHASAILVLGMVAVMFGSSIPPDLGDIMGRIVGGTLVVLGIAVMATVLTDRGDFTARSRWLILFSGLGRIFSVVRRWLGLNSKNEHEHEHDTPHHGLEPVEDDDSAVHSHIHSHDVSGATGVRSAVGIGVLHGIGAETPSQILLFVAASTATGIGSGIGALLAFILGLVVANSVVTMVAAFGFAQFTQNPRVQVAMGTLAGVFSIAIGLLFLFGSDALPNLLS